MQGRGLKLFFTTKGQVFWLSPLMQGRGLKLFRFQVQFGALPSPLMQGRGLKPQIQPIPNF